MGTKIELMRSKEAKSRADVATFLRELADKVDSGQILFQQGEAGTSLDLPENVMLKIKADQKAKGTRTKFGMEFEMEWYEGEEGVTLGAPESQAETALSDIVEETALAETPEQETTEEASPSP